ncbi:hypothetical protein GNF83_22790, partial [Clostridium perfringens]|nr:hypothetical protein [Clostridium perfringens]
YVQPAAADSKPVKAKSEGAAVRAELTGAELVGATFTALSSFADVSGHWAKEFITSAAALGLVNGVSDTQYKPNASVTRAEFAAMLGRTLEGIYGVVSDTAGSGEAKFKDVAANAWYADEVAAGARLQ